MTRRQLKRTIIAVIVLYSFALVVGLYLYYSNEANKSHHYPIYKDLMPLIITIPAAYLGFCFQRRASFLLALRLLRTNLTTAVNVTLQYTYKRETSSDDYTNTLISISKSIDEVRCVYRNLRESKNDDGHYPFESLNEIYNITKELGYGTMQEEKTKEARKNIKLNWGDIRRTFLWEFDRSEPSVYDSPHIKY